MAIDDFRKINITLNKANQHVLETQIAKVGDVNGRELVVQITNNGVIEDQTGTSLKLNWQHENGNQGSTNFKVIDIKTGRFSVYYPKELLYTGEVNASIEINSNGQITNSFNFNIIVQADVFNGEAGTVNGVFISLADVNKKLNERENEYKELKERQTSVESQFVEVQQEMTNKDVSSSAEIIAARNGEDTLKERIDNVANGGEGLILENKNAKKPLNIPAYTVSNQVTHPSVIYIENGFGGYKFWMAFTPYPSSNDDFENPSIVASKDGIKWVVPSGLTNPIDIPTSAELANGDYMSDTHLIMDGDHLLLVYRFSSNNNDTLFYRTSSDGVNWSSRTAFYTSANAGGNYVMSPAIIKDGNTYKMWFVDLAYKVQYTESTDLISWTAKKEVPVSFEKEDYMTWHIDVKKIDSKYVLIDNAIRKSDGNKRDILYATSDDGKSFTNAKVILKPSSFGWDSGFLYRASILKIKNAYVMYYGAFSNNVWGIGMVSGNSIDTMHDVEISNFNSLTLNSLETNVIKSSSGNAIFSYNDITLSSDKGKKPQIKLQETGVTSAAIELITNGIQILNNAGANGGIKAGPMTIESLNRPNGAPIYVYVNLNITRDSGTRAEIRLAETGKHAASIGTNDRNYLGVYADNGTDLGSLQVGHLTVGNPTNVPVKEGAIRYNPYDKKHQGYDGTKWNNLY